MSILLGEARNSVDVDDLVDKNLVKYWKDLKKRPNIIGNLCLFTK